jgi:hypothetical protein
MRDQDSAVQLRLIVLVHEALLDAQIPHWLAGGWGIDFLLGRVTRDHGDIDFAVWKEDWPRVEALLHARDFTSRPNQLPEETGRLLKDGCKFEFYLLQINSKGQVIVGGRWSDWPFPEGSFGDLIGELDCIECPVLSPEGQLDSKERWPEQPHGGPLRPKDAQDIELLREFISSHGREDIKTNVR